MIYLGSVGSKDMSLFDEVYEICKKIPKGKVTTYGDIAFMMGRPRCSRQVGWALHVNPEPRSNSLPQGSK